MVIREALRNKVSLQPLLTLVLLALLPPMLRVDVYAAPVANTMVGGPIISDTTWTLANSPYIVTSNVQVMTGVTLTIQAGVVVKFDADKLLQVDGTLIAQGTAGNPITFTSNQASPQPGDWDHICFTDSSVDATFDGGGNYTGGSVLHYCTVEYGESDYGAIQTTNASPLLDHCTVRNNGNSGICAVGTSDAPVVIRDSVVNGNSARYSGGGIYAEYSMVINNTISDNSAHCGGGINANYSTVTGNTVRDNFVSGSLAYGGGIHTYYSIVISNTVYGNSADKGGGIYAIDGSTVSDNIVNSNSASYGGGIYVYSYGVPVTVTSNTVTGNDISASGQGSGVYCYGSCNFLYNTFVGNTTVSPTAVIGGVAIDGTPQFHYNNLYGNSNYDMVVVSSGNISGTNNYWGTVATVDILAHVYDWYDDSSRGRLLYIPYLQAPPPDAPVPPPQNLQANFTNGSAGLSWDPIPSTATGYGYKVYYDNDASGSPYDGTGATQGDSPINVGNVTNYALSGLGSGTTYVAVTAYDTLGRESWYSNEVNSGREVYLPLMLRNY